MRSRCCSARAGVRPANRLANSSSRRQTTPDRTTTMRCHAGLLAAALARHRPAGRAAPFAEHSLRHLRPGAGHLRAHRARQVRAVQPPGRHRGASAWFPMDAATRWSCRSATHDAWEAYAQSPGLLGRGAGRTRSAACSCRYAVEAAANAFFAKASVSIGSALLSVGNANLLMAHDVPVRTAGGFIAGRCAHPCGARWRRVRRRSVGAASTG